VPHFYKKHTFTSPKCRTIPRELLLHFPPSVGGARVEPLPSLRILPLPSSSFPITPSG